MERKEHSNVPEIRDKYEKKPDLSKIFKEAGFSPTLFSDVKTLLEAILRGKKVVITGITAGRAEHIHEENWYVKKEHRNKLEQLTLLFSVLQKLMEETREELRNSPSEDIQDFIRDGGLNKVVLEAGESPYKHSEL